MKLVHHDRRHFREVKVIAVEQTVEQNLGDDDQHLGVRIDFVVACDESHIFRLKSPTDGGFLNLLKLLIGQRDQRRRVVSRLSGMQSLEQSRFRNQSLTHPGRSRNKHSLFRVKPLEDGVFLNRVRLVRNLIQKLQSDFITIGHSECLITC